MNAESFYPVDVPSLEPDTQREEEIANISMGEEPRWRERVNALKRKHSTYSIRWASSIDILGKAFDSYNTLPSLHGKFSFNQPHYALVPSRPLPTLSSLTQSMQQIS